MLLLHQSGSVRVGELVRYTVTYTPSSDRILPTPTHLHVKIKNTSAIPLRAAWLHGPYVLHVAAYPSTFNPHRKVEEPQKYGVPEYEPMLKAGGSWLAKLTVPEDIRETGADLGKRRHSTEQQSGDQDGKNTVTWIIEITSQILFSNSASVNFELLVGRDERSLDLGFAAVAGHGHGAPGQLKQQQQSDKERRRARKHGNVQTAGVYSRAVRLVVEDTQTLWDKPGLPSWEDQPDSERKSMDTRTHGGDEKNKDKAQKKKRKKLHLVVLTHGLHSNLGADMLFLKESIDATVTQARLDAKKRKESYRKTEAEKKKQPANSDATEAEKRHSEQSQNDTSTAPLSGGQEDIDGANEGSDDDEEETIVRGFTGNAVKTENGIQYLGKRLAKYILRFTYPDQPFLPVKKPLTRTLTDTFKSEAGKAKRDGQPSHSGSSIRHPQAGQKDEELPYTFTSISFVGHSLGGLIQTYAVAYIHKHSPTFFQQIKPVNFICMASPMLGLSNENPLYVKFALDFGLVGKTGQDLGLTWRPNTLARGGWNAVIGGLGAGQKEQKQEDPSAKPLLRILPTGPAHQVLRMFRNRTVYSNVVNDGIVPLRTSCLLFLDWRGLGKVEKARRENGLIGTAMDWAWAEVTGANSNSLRPNVIAERFESDEDDDNEHVMHGEGDTVPLPAEDETTQDNKTNRLSVDAEALESSENSSASASKHSTQQDKGMLDTFFDFFKSNPTQTLPQPSKKTSKALHRGQTIHHGEDELPEEAAEGREGTTSNPTMLPHSSHSGSDQKKQKRPVATKGESYIDGRTGEMQAPPKTSIFESAGDILHPPLPSRQWIVDPSSRSRTIFHDRVYHPEDIPPPPMKRPGSRLGRSFSSDSVSKRSLLSDQSSTVSQETTDSGAMKVEEKIARAYHRDLSWRKVLVRLEPDAHNNMIVRRMFANAYGWPVIKHVCDTHFADTFSAKTRDEDEPARERAQPIDAPVPETGEEVKNQTSKQVPGRTQSETREARDELADLKVPRQGVDGSYSSNRMRLDRQSSAVWDDSFFEGSDGEEDSDVDERNLVQRLINPVPPKKPEPAHHKPESSHNAGVPMTATTKYTDGHRGLAPISPTSPKTPGSVRSAASTQPTFDSANVEWPSTPVLTDRLVEEPQALQESPGSTAELGLRKSIAEQVTPSKLSSKD